MAGPASAMIIRIEATHRVALAPQSIPPCPDEDDSVG